MITIFTDGQQLDLDSNGTFELTIDQPMLDDSHAPIPFSTSIGLLATPNNKKILGFLDAMLLEPNVKRLPADIFVGGFKILSGILVYDGYEGGVLNYSFSGKNLEDDWNAKIWTQVNPDISTIPAAYTNEEKLEFINAIKEGSHFLGAPILVNQNAVAKTTFGLMADFTEQVSPSVKYHNWPGTDDVIFTPVFRLNLILERILKIITVDTMFSADFGMLAIIAQYKPDGHFNQIGIPLSGAYDCQNMLPDISIYQMVQNLAKIYCAAIYRDGQQYRLIGAQSILDSDAVLDWSEKISTDSYSLGKEAATSYILKFNNSDEDNVYDVSNLSEDLEAGDITTCQAFEDLIHNLGGIVNGEDTGPKAVRHAATRDIYSGRKQVFGRAHYLICSDILYHHNPVINTELGSAESSFDNSIDFNLVKCLPESYPKGDTCQYRMAPVIEAPTIGETRGSNVYIGIFANNQLVDKGIYINTAGEDTNLGVSLSPDSLFKKYHQAFADWLAQDRQTVTASLNLSIKDIVSFRMFNKVRFASRTWIVKKLTLTFSVDSDHVEATGEFISC